MWILGVELWVQDGVGMVGWLVLVVWWLYTKDDGSDAMPVRWHELIKYWLCHEILQIQFLKMSELLIHWGRVTHICVGKLTNIGSDNNLSPGRRQAIIWTIAEILLIGPLGTKFSEFVYRNSCIFIQ